MSTVGQVLFAFFEDHLKVQKGLRPGSIRSYRDTLKLFLGYVATSCRRPITRLAPTDLCFQRVLDFARSTATSPCVTPKCSPKRRGWRRFPRSEHHLQKRVTWSAMKSISCSPRCRRKVH